jgi:metal-responsive CopG/Arc/MetJ family transcriptional regulator
MPELTERIIIPLARDLLERIDNFRFAGRFQSRAAAIRELIEIGLAGADHRTAPPGPPRRLDTRGRPP